MDYQDIIDLGLKQGDSIRFKLLGRWTSFEEIAGTFHSVNQTSFKYSTCLFQEGVSAKEFVGPIGKIDNLVKVGEIVN